MPIHIQLRCALDYRVDESRLTAAAMAVLDQHPSFRDASLTIVIASADVLRRLNLRHRKVDAATDVLAFKAPPLPDGIDQAEQYLGDILIAYELAAAQAQKRDAPLAETLCLLVVHATLHLLGYQHDTEEECDHMWGAQARALDSIGICSAIVAKYETAKLA